MTGSKLSIYLYLCLTVFLLITKGIQAETPKDFSPFTECIDDPTRMYRYAVGEWRVKNIRVMPDAQQRVLPSEHILTKEEFAAIEENHLIIKKEDIQTIGYICFNEFRGMFPGHMAYFSDTFAEIGIAPDVKYIYKITIHEIGYFYFLINYDELLAMPAVLFDTAIGRIRLPEAHYVIFERVSHNF